MQGPLLVSDCSAGGNHFVEEDELPSDFLMWVMNLQVISGREALGKQEGTGASPLLGAAFTWEEKAAKSKELHEHSHHSQAHHELSYQTANWNHRII